MNKSTHYIATLGSAIVLVSAVTTSSGAQKYSDWFTTDQPRPNRQLDRDGPGTGDL